MKRHEILVNGSPVALTGDVHVITYRELRPGEMIFSCIGNIEVGSIAELYYDDSGIFRGKVFKAKSSDGITVCECYDLLRYFDNPISFEYTEKTVSELLLMICITMKFPIGNIIKTRPRISRDGGDGIRISSLIEAALSISRVNGYGDYAVYDSFGKICMDERRSHMTDTIISPSVCSDFSVTESADDIVNYITLDSYGIGGSRTYYARKDDDSIEKYGMLCYCGSLAAYESGYIAAGKIIEEYSTPKTEISCTYAGFDPKIRGGRLIPVIDTEPEFMFCDRAEYIFTPACDTMKLSLSSR